MRDDLRSRFRSTLTELGHETPDMARSRAQDAEPLVKALLHEHARKALGGPAQALHHAVSAVCSDGRARPYLRAFGRAGVERLAAEEAPQLAAGRKAWRRLSDELRKAVARRG